MIFCRESGRVSVATGICAVALTAALGTAAPASALEINVALKVGGGATPQPVGVIGSGTLLDIAEAAATVWQAALGDGGAGTTFDIEVAWGGLGGSVVATTFVDTVGGVKTAGPAAIGTHTSPEIWFNSARSDWYLDADPLDPSEYGPAMDYSNAGGLITGQYFLAESAPLENLLDLFTVMLHEIGHAIGFLDYTSSPFDDGGVTLAAPLPGEGFEVPLSTSGGGHIFVPLTPEQEGGTLLERITAAVENNRDYAHTLLFTSIALGERRLPSLLDLASVAQVVGYDLVDQDAPMRLAGGERFVTADVPAPAAGLLALSGIAALGALRRRRKVA